MKTGYFWKALHEPDKDAKYISISAGVQRGAEHLPVYDVLKPSWDIIRLAHESNYSAESLIIYKGVYFAQLDRLDAQTVYNDLFEYTIVCGEAPKDLAAGKKYCHRRMIAGWIETRLGIVIHEEVRTKDIGLIVPAIFR